MAAAAAVSSVDESVKALGDSFDGIPVIDVGAWLKKDGAEVDAETIATECAKAAASLRKYGCVFARDPRVDSKDNDRFLDTLEKYFETPEDARMKDTHPELSYQVGATPAFTELPRNHCDRMKAYKDTDKPLSECPPEKDCKWRFFWRIGERPAETKFGELNAAPVVPEGIPEWTDVMNTWGGKLLGCVTCVAQMAARGFGLEDDAFSSRMDMGPHLLAPTATDLKRFGKEGTVCAGYHRDLNFLTIHGKSRFPGLYVWTREGKKLAVRVPEGCLLVQAGIQAEYITAGHVMAGYHEVVVTPQTLEAVERATAAGRSIWRISSTLFSHMASDGMLEPIGKFASEEAAKDYPPVLVGDQVKAELAAINLKGDAAQPYGLAYAPHHAHAPGADSHQFAAHAGAYGRPGAPEHGGWPGSLAAGPAHGMPDHATAHHGDDDSTTAGPGGARASEFNLDSCGPFRCGCVRGKPELGAPAAVAAAQLTRQQLTPSGAIRPCADYRGSSVCNDTFPDVASLVAHRQDAHGVVPPAGVACPLCFREVSCRSHLNRHMRGCHTRDHRWSCEECGKSFSSLSNRDAHIRSVHRKTRPFVCKACPRAFSRRTHLRVHCRKVHGVDIGSRTHTVTWKDIHRLAAGGTADSDLAGHGGASRAHEEEQDEEDDDDDTHSGRTSRDGEASHDREGALGPSQDGPHGAKSVLVPTGGVLPVVPSMSSHRAAMGSTLGSHGYHTSASADVHGVFGRLQHASSPTGAASSANTASTAVSETGEPGCEPSARARVITICPPNLSSPGLDAALPTSSRG